MTKATVDMRVVERGRVGGGVWGYDFCETMTFSMWSVLFFMKETGGASRLLVLCSLAMTLAVIIWLVGGGGCLGFWFFLQKGFGVNYP